MLMQSGAAAALGAKAASMRPVRARASVVVNAAGILGDKCDPCQHLLLNITGGFYHRKIPQLRSHACGITSINIMQSAMAA